MSNEETNRKPIRVTHLLHTIAYGGIETVIINWIRYSRPEDLDIQLVVFANPGGSEQAFIEEARKHDLQVECIPWSRRKPVLKAARALRALMASHHTEVLHTHNAYAELVGLVTRRLHPVKLLTTVYVWAGRDFGFKRYVLQKMSAWLIKRFDLLTVQCEKAQTESKAWGFREEEVRVLPSGYEIQASAKLSTEKREAARLERGAKPGEVVVCNIARLYPEKGQVRMLHMWKRIVATHPQARLWIYGVGPLEEELLALWRELELQDSVKFMGFASDLMMELQLCEMQWHPSYNEGIPIAICAGMAAGLPIVATAVGGIPEVIKDERSGLLVDRDDEAAIQESTERLIADADLRKRLGTEARRFVVEEYSMEFAVGVLSDTYRELVGQR
jgi:glycosyltransferase involved in cell wall biosynthesis